MRHIMTSAHTTCRMLSRVVTSQHLLMEVNGGEASACKSYLIADRENKKAALLDPIKPNIPTYLSLLAYHGLELEYVFDTHSHADHHTAGFELSRLTMCKLSMHENAHAPLVNMHVNDGDVINVGNIELRVMYTPGHTSDSMALYLPQLGHLFSGDTLLIGGTGRTDFAGGDPGMSYDSIQRMFQLPEDTVLWPGHDYRGNIFSTIGHEKKHNPRIGGGKTRQEYIEIMNNLGLPLPEKIVEALQCNVSAIHDPAMKFPTMTELNQTRQLDPQEILSLLQEPEEGKRPVIFDVRLAHELSTEPTNLDIIHIPLAELPKRVAELEQFKDRMVICLCRTGVRSTTAVALLTGMGFVNAHNMRGGVLALKKLTAQERAS